MRIAITRVLLLPVALGAGACLPIPHQHTTEAGARFHVADSTGRALTGVTLNAYAGNVMGRELRRLRSVTTDPQGNAAFPRRRRWEYFIFLLVTDVEAPSVFAWCAEREGLATQVGRLEDAADQPIDVPMAASSSPDHCPPTLDVDRLRSVRMLPEKKPAGVKNDSGRSRIVQPSGAYF
jgi:hypothetical protein